ncbi:prolyl oligopeptidase family serine peptidase, partial [Clostridium perfringens]|uniref:carboxylesterase family protein n=1 Tax=Clostridium perfringens TaxID=1502 RepID=UPI002AC67BE3
YEYSKTNESTPIVDDFKSSTHKVEGVGSLNYRMFSPDVKDGQKYPLVLFLHGAGERGSNNDLQLLGNKGAVAWASPENQAKNPSFVVAPQKLPTGYPTEDNWTTGETYEVLMDLVKELVKDLPVDTDRIYVTGMSMGGNGTWTLIQRNPELFAAAIPVCGWLDNPEDIQGIKEMPIWT